VIRQCLAAGRVAADEQQRVVARDGAEDVVELGLVDGGGEELRRARRGARHDQVGRRLGRDEQLPGQPGHPLLLGRLTQRRPGRAESALAGHGVDEFAAGVADLHRAQVVEVAAERGLGDVQPVVGEELRQLALRAHRLPAQDLHDPAVPGGARLGQGQPCVVPLALVCHAPSPALRVIGR
jgi:hypothetical protein